MQPSAGGKRPQPFQPRIAVIERPEKFLPLDLRNMKSRAIGVEIAMPVKCANMNRCRVCCIQKSRAKILPRVGTIDRFVNGVQQAVIL
jgi:hypothetical protein